MQNLHATYYLMCCNTAGFTWYQPFLFFFFFAFQKQQALKNRGNFDNLQNNNYDTLVIDTYTSIYLKAMICNKRNPKFVKRLDIALLVYVLKLLKL